MRQRTSFGSLEGVPHLAIRLRIANHAIALAIVALLGSGIASAQERAQPNERELTPDERARELFLRGDRLYAEGNYDEAIVALKEAYDLSHRPALLFNIANAYERLGRYEEALLYLNQYAPSAPDHQQHIVLKRIRALELRAEERRRQDHPSATPTAPPARAPATSAARESTSAAGAHLDASPSPLPSPEAEAAKRQSLLGYAIGGAGLVAIGVGTVFGVSASSLRSDAEGQCVDNGDDLLCPASARDSLSDADSRALVADIAWGLGLAAVGVGVYLVLDANGESGTSTALRSTVTAGGAGVSLVHAF
jgi:tetratricopeptide repeat protein